MFCQFLFYVFESSEQCLAVFNILAHLYFFNFWIMIKMRSQTFVTKKFVMLWTIKLYFLFLMNRTINRFELFISELLEELFSIFDIHLLIQVRLYVIKGTCNLKDLLLFLRLYTVTTYVMTARNCDWNTSSFIKFFVA
jgi:hypothetical protein